MENVNMNLVIDRKRIPDGIRAISPCLQYLIGEYTGCDNGRTIYKFGIESGIESGIEIIEKIRIKDAYDIFYGQQCKYHVFIIRRVIDQIKIETGFILHVLNLKELNFKELNNKELDLTTHEHNKYYINVPIIKYENIHYLSDFIYSWGNTILNFTVQRYIAIYNLSYFHFKLYNKYLITQNRRQYEIYNLFPKSDYIYTKIIHSDSISIECDDIYDILYINSLIFSNYPNDYYIVNKLKYQNKQLTIDFMSVTDFSKLDYFDKSVTNLNIFDRSKVITLTFNIRDIIWKYNFGSKPNIGLSQIYLEKDRLFINGSIDNNKNILYIYNFTNGQLLYTKISDDMTFIIRYNIWYSHNVKKHLYRIKDDNWNFASFHLLTWRDKITIKAFFINWKFNCTYLGLLPIELLEYIIKLMVTTL